MIKLIKKIIYNIRANKRSNKRFKLTLLDGGFYN